MKIEVHTPPPVERTITLTLTQTEYNTLVIGYGLSSQADREGIALQDGMAVLSNTDDFYGALVKELK